MVRIKRTPIAWLLLAHDWPRTTRASAGLTAAVVLMFVQLGFRNGLFDGQRLILDQLDAEVFLLPRIRPSQSVDYQHRFSRRRIYQVQSHPLVEGAWPLWAHYPAIWKDHRHEDLLPVRVIGYRVGDPIWRDGPGSPDSLLLRRIDTLAVDRQFRGRETASLLDSSIEINHHRFQVVDLTDIGCDFVADGNVFMSDQNFVRLFPHLGVENVSAAVVRLKAGADKQTVVRELKQMLPADVDVVSKVEALQREDQFWSKSTPVGIVFTVGMGLGFIVGLLIGYQVLQTEIADNLSQFTVLEAIGYPARFLMVIVIKESLLLAIFSFVPGLCFSAGIYFVLSYMTAMPMRLSGWRIGVVAALTVTMCVLSGLLAIRQVLKSDPADAFNG